MQARIRSIQHHRMRMLEIDHPRSSLRRGPNQFAGIPHPSNPNLGGHPGRQDKRGILHFSHGRQRIVHGMALTFQL